jgi:hypothetical protein
VADPGSVRLDRDDTGDNNDDATWVTGDAGPQDMREPSIALLGWGPGDPVANRRPEAAT